MSGLLKFIKLTNKEKADLRQNERKAIKQQKKLSKDKVIKQIIKRTGFDMDKLKHSVSIIEANYRSHLSRRLWRQVVWRVKLMSERVLQAMHGPEIADLEFATEQWEEWRDKSQALEKARDEIFTRLTRELNEKLEIEKNVYDYELTTTIERIQKEMNEKLQHLELTLHDPEWLEKPETKSSTTWYHCSLDIKKTEDLRRINKFRKYVIQCRKEMKEAHMENKKEKKVVQEGLTFWHTKYMDEMQEYYKKEIGYTSKELKTWSKERSGCRGLILQIRKLIVQSQASGDAYIPIGGDEIYEIKSEWAQLPNTRDIAKILSGQTRNQKSKLDYDDEDEDVENMKDELLFEQ